MDFFLSSFKDKRRIWLKHFYYVVTTDMFMNKDEIFFFLNVYKDRHFELKKKIMLMVLVCVCFWVSVGRGRGAMRETMLVFRGIPNEPR